MISFDWSVASPLLRSFAFYSFGIAAYAIFVFLFYRFLARKSIFNLNLRQYNDIAHPGLQRFFDILLYLIEYIIILPLCTFLWFFILTMLLVFMAKGHTAQSLLLVSIAVVSAVRITSYFSEDLSLDLAKMLPFALLAVFLADAHYVSLAQSFELLLQIPSYVSTIIYYLFFTILLEFILRALYLLFGTDWKRQRSQ